jgi:CBS domain-containing protein
MKVHELMSDNVSCCDSDTPLREVASMMVDCDCGEIPVVDAGGRVIGVVTDRDITCRAVAQGLNPLEMTADDCMTSPAVTVQPHASVDECCEALEATQIRRVPVVDEAGRCIGIVSLADIAREGSRRATAEVVQKVSKPSTRPSATAL